VELIVPPGTQVELECREILSSSKQPKRRRATAEPNGLLVVVEGQFVLGSLTIKERPPSGSRPTLRQRLGLG
jgi:hypothetical protein